MSAEPVRTVWGLSAEGWAVWAFLLVVVSICCQEIGRFLASLSAGNCSQTDDRPSSIPAYRQEAMSARTGKWNR